MRELVLEKLTKSAKGLPFNADTVRKVINDQRISIINTLIQSGLTEAEAEVIASKKHVMLFIILDD